LPNALGWQTTIASRSNALDTLIIPFGPFFAIWLVIFLGCLGFALSSVVSAARGSRFDPGLGWCAAAFFATNAIWELYVLARGLDVGSFIIIALLVAFGLTTMRSLETAPPSAPPVFVAGVRLFAGWVSFAIFANLSSAMLTLDPIPLDARDEMAAALLLGAAIVVIVPLAYRFASYAYAAGPIWGLSGVAVRAWLDSASGLLVGLPLLGVVSVAAAVILARRSKGCPRLY
ncbi:MAG: hypothetical protein AAFQ17_06280, partial [Pseudomonadota bacterium]